MTVALDPEKEQCYVPKADRDLEEAKQTRFYFKPLPYRDRVDILDHLVVELKDRKKEGTETLIKSATTQKRVLLTAVTRVENLKTGEGADVSYPSGSNDARKMDFWTWVPADVIMELANFILNGTELAEEEEKN